METALHSLIVASPSGGWQTRIGVALRGHLRRRTVYRQTLKELQLMTDRELNDIGLSAAMIHSVASDAARAA
jgi:uncharacterized protein YjiS (DUF1127 family)